MELGLNPDKVCFIIVKAREWAAQTGPGAPLDGSNPIDDQGAAAISPRLDRNPEQEIRSILDTLNDAELLNLHALALIGRGTHEKENWEDARGDALAIQNDGETIPYLLDMPLLADHLEEGLAQFGKTCRDYGSNSD